MARNEETPHLFTLDVDFKDPIRKNLFPLVKGPLEKLFNLNDLNEIYGSVATTPAGKEFVGKLLESMNVKFRASESDMLRIPKEGPLVVVANHPYGAIEGVLVVALLSAVRPDVKVMANFLLERIPQLRDFFIFVDPFGGAESKRANIKGMRQSIDHVQQGGCLVIFPAGEVAHFNLKNWTVTDPVWSDSIARIIRKTEAPVLPVFFEGYNGPMFHLMGLVHPRLRTAMLPHEMANKRDKKINIHIGNPIPFKKLAEREEDSDLMSYLRQRTYVLANRDKKEIGERKSIFAFSAKKAKMEPVIEAVPAEKMLKDLDKLLDCRMFVNNESEVYVAPAARIPNILREIGRLREITFRESNEGTGKAIDIDKYDADYMHLFIWNAQKLEIVGAYRLGQTDLIMEKSGKKGLYTSTLFKYKTKLLEEINPALEMGRSFIRPEYQRSFSALLLLWKGIGAYVVKNPRYKILFGPVSINNEYHSVSRSLMVAFLEMNNFSKELAKLVKAKTPFKKRAIKGVDKNVQSTIVKNLDEVNSVIADVETRQKGIPVLLKQYLTMGGTLLGFNIDPDFSDVLDGLILVDLTKSETKMLERYLGEEGSASFLQFHGIERPDLKVKKGTATEEVS
jgi:putative hemolysin